MNIITQLWTRFFSEIASAIAHWKDKLNPYSHSPKYADC